MSIWIGRILSAVVVVLLLADADTKLLAPGFIRTEMEATGFPINLAPVLGIIIAICTIFYAVPKTAFLGAILITGFLGGAICTPFRLGEYFIPPQIVSLLLGIAAWVACICATRDCAS